MTKGFFEKGDFLMEFWCAGVPDSDKANAPLKILELVEQTDEYEVYDVMDNSEFVVGKVKVYLDKDVLAGGERLLGCRCDAYSILEKTFCDRNFCVFEVIEGFEMYKMWCRASYDSTAAQKEVTDDTPHLVPTVDLETGDIYDVDLYNYVWVDGKRTNMWFTEDGTLIKPRTDFEGVQNGVQEEVQSDVQEDTQEEEVAAKGFDCVVGMEELKQQLRDEVLWPMQHKELMEQYRLHPLNGMLLYGPPGCGKTYIAQKFAEESNMNFELVTAADVTAHFIHQTAGKIREMFENARKKAPCILCIDEIDSLVPDRSQVGLESGAVDVHESVNEFLSHMNNCSKDGIFVVGTSNSPYSIDPALLRTGRMDKIIYVGLPNEESRKALIEFYLKDRPQDEGIDTSELARLADGMNASDIEFLVNSVALKAAMAQAAISFDALAEQAKTQRRSVYIPKETESEKAMPAYTKVMGFGFSQPESGKGKIKKSCA